MFERNIMDSLFRFQANVLKSVNDGFYRYLYPQINWNQQLIGIKGLRGVGKTTLLLQHLKYKLPAGEALYVTADHPFFYNKGLLELAEDFVAQGGKTLVIDEVHKYENWSRELKNIYDGLPELKVIFTSSSALDILKGEADLSRRVAIYNLRGMSFREYINFTQKLDLKANSLADTLKNHVTLSTAINEQLKPLPIFKAYLKQGYFPFGLQLEEKDFQKRLLQVLNTVLEVDLAYIEGYSVSNIIKIKRLLGVLAEIVPYQPNISDLALRLSLGRDTVLAYLNHLQQAGILNFIYSAKAGMSNLRKPEKIYLENTNLAYALKEQPNIGSIRESFLLNQLQSIDCLVTLPEKGDFVIDQNTTVEVGGKNKAFEQIKDLNNAYVLADDIEIGYQKKIPLWLFGFLY